MSNFLPLFYLQALLILSITETKSILYKFERDQVDQR
jgi:hypothetical protein